MKILGVRWFCGRSNVGIVRVHFEAEDETRYYIKAVSGVNEEDDSWDIAHWGTTFPTDAGNVLFGIVK